MTITTHDLAKDFGKVQAVRGLNWDVPRGSIYGLLGPNGAGKSTTLRMLLGGLLLAVRRFKRMDF